MKISKKTHLATQSVTNPSREYGSHSLIIRESILSLSIRLFFAEFFIGIVGILIRVPLLYIFSSIAGPLQTYTLYGLFYLLFQTVNVGVIIYILLDWYNRTYTIRDADMYLQSGVFSVQDELIQYDNMERVHLTQSLLGRVGNFGTIEIYNPLLRGSTYLKDIPDPRMYAQKIQGFIPKNNSQPIIFNN